MVHTATFFGGEHTHLVQLHEVPEQPEVAVGRVAAVEPLQRLDAIHSRNCRVHKQHPELTTTATTTKERSRGRKGSSEVVYAPFNSWVDGCSGVNSVSDTTVRRQLCNRSTQPDQQLTMTYMPLNTRLEQLRLRP